MKYQSLKTLLDILCVGNKLHICIHDVSGILEQTLLNLPQLYKIHASTFCDAAKKTASGLNLCMRCKNICNKKAVKYGRLFDGLCPNGIYELVYPVTINNAIKCIIYIGNIIDNIDKTSERIEKTSLKTGVSASKVKTNIKYTQKFISREHYISIAKLLENYIKLLYQNTYSAQSSDCHWAVKNICNDIETQFFGDLSLKQEAQLYLLNEKYAGRLFKKEIGFTFHEYLNRIRIMKSENLLCETNHSILDISMECGFQNITYFNRLFKQKHGISPSCYRKTYNS